MSDASSNVMTHLGSIVRDAAVGHREKLQAALGSVEAALASPAPGRLSAWTLALRADMVHLREEFTVHMAITEGDDGLYEEILERAPHLAHAVDGVRGEHAEIAALIDEALARLEHEPIGIGTELDPMDRVAELRDACTTILGRLVRHRQRGADLTHQAYQVDVGGDG